MITSKLSRAHDAQTLRRLETGWKDPDVTLVTLGARFGITPEDVEKLKLELGAKAKAEPLSPWFKADRARRDRQRQSRLLASTVRRVL